MFKDKMGELLVHLKDEVYHAFEAREKYNEMCFSQFNLSCIAISG